MKELLIFATIILAALYYTYKKRFEIVYTLFLSGIVGTVLKYMVSSSLTFTAAPPSLEIMLLSTLAVFSSFFWFVVLGVFIMYIDGPLAAVSGLLLGYGLGKWHSMKRKKILVQKGEVKRKVIHSVSGIVLSIPPFILDKSYALPLYALGAVFFGLSGVIKLPFIKNIISETKRKTEWTGKGAFYYMIGSLLPIYLGQPWIILVLGIGDGLATLIGRFFGYTPLYKKKSVEGSFAGFLGAWAISQHFYSPAIIPAIIFFFAELFAPIDDNLAIPLAMSLIYLV